MNGTSYLAQVPFDGRNFRWGKPLAALSASGVFRAQRPTIAWEGFRSHRHVGEPFNEKYIVDTKCDRNSLLISQAWKRHEDFNAKWLA